MATYPNHIRTLLLNRARGVYPPEFPGEEYVSADFNPREMPTAYKRIRSLLFGGNPDRHMLNLRLYQLMQAIHATELDEYTVAHDARITYLPLDRPEYQTLFGYTATGDPGTVGELFVIGEPTPNMVAGRIYEQWRVFVLDGANVQVQKKTAPMQTEVQAYTVSDGLSSICDLSGSNLRFYFSGGAGSLWTVETVARPNRTMADVVSDLSDTIAITEEQALFGVTPVEPYKTFRNLWRTHESYTYRLGGLALALAYQTDLLPEE
jgi:hypothetical protein